MTGGKYANAHFKVKLFGNINGRAVVHQHCIYIEHRSAYGRHDYVMARDERDENYPYTTLVAVGGPPSSCPMRRRLQREQQEAAALSDGWYADPWAADTGKAERYYANGEAPGGQINPPVRNTNNLFLILTIYLLLSLSNFPYFYYPSYLIYLAGLPSGIRGILPAVHGTTSSGLPGPRRRLGAVADHTRRITGSRGHLRVHGRPVSAPGTQPRRRGVVLPSLVYEEAHSQDIRHAATMEGRCSPVHWAA